MCTVVVIVLAVSMIHIRMWMLQIVPCISYSNVTALPLVELSRSIHHEDASICPHFNHRSRPRNL